MTNNLQGYFDIERSTRLDESEAVYFERFSHYKKKSRISHIVIITYIIVLFKCVTYILEMRSLDK